jgi:tetratricopeptide (TPR) repeat protein
LQYFQKALAIRLAAFGENHPDVAMSYHNIGVVYNQQGRYTEALQHFQKALAIQLAAFGENHPDVALSYNNMGAVYESQGAEALQHFQKALEALKGSNMKRQKVTIKRLQGRYLEALQHPRLAAFGENHPYVARIYKNIGNVYSSQERYGGFAVLSKRARYLFSPSSKITLMWQTVTIMWVVLFNSRLYGGFAIFPKSARYTISHFG